MYRDFGVFGSASDESQLIQIDNSLIIRVKVKDTLLLNALLNVYRLEEELKLKTLQTVHSFEQNPNQTSNQILNVEKNSMDIKVNNENKTEDKPKTDSIAKENNSLDSQQNVFNDNNTENKTKSFLKKIGFDMTYNEKKSTDLKIVNNLSNKKGSEPMNYLEISQKPFTTERLYWTRIIQLNGKPLIAVVYNPFDYLIINTFIQILKQNQNLSKVLDQNWDQFLSLLQFYGLNKGLNLEKSRQKMIEVFKLYVTVCNFNFKSFCYEI